MKALQTFEPNLLGRDFMIGDLHGSLSLLGILLEDIKFDYERDRLFSVGDLVDRGEDHLQCLALLRERWFHAVRANHEEMLLAGTLHHDNDLAGSWMMNGGLWALQSVGRILNKQQLEPEDEELLELAKLADELPYIITVKLKSGEQVHLVHAELPPILGITDADLASEEFVTQIARHTENNPYDRASTRSHLLWGREVFLNFYRADLSNHAQVVRTARYHHFGHQPNLSRVVSGHTIVQRPMTIFNFTCIDTAAYDVGRKPWAGLTCLELDTWTFRRARPEGVTIVEPVVVNSYPTTGD